MKYVNLKMNKENHQNLILNQSLLNIKFINNFIFFIFLTNRRPVIYFLDFLVLFFLDFLLLLRRIFLAVEPPVILNILVLHFLQLPFIAFLPFFIVTLLPPFISLLLLHFIQYAFSDIIYIINIYLNER